MPLQQVTRALPNAVQGLVYLQTFHVIGAAAPLVYTDLGTSTNIKVQPDGSIIGSGWSGAAQTASASVTDSINTPITVSATVASTTVSGSLAIDVSAMPTTASQGGFYFGRVKVTGGKPPYVCTATFTGVNTARFKMDSAPFPLAQGGSWLEGQPTVTGNTVATVTVVDSANASVTASTVTIDTVSQFAAMGVDTAATSQKMPDATVGNSYEGVPWTIGASAAVTTTLSAGTLPAGLSLSSGIIVGKPTSGTTGGTTSTFTLHFASGALTPVTQQYTITVYASQNVTRPTANTGNGFFIAYGKPYDPNGAPFRHYGTNVTTGDFAIQYLKKFQYNTGRFEIYSTDTVSTWATIISDAVAAGIFPILAFFGTPSGTTSNSSSFVHWGYILDAMHSAIGTVQTAINANGAWNPANEWNASGSASVWRDTYKQQTGSITSVAAGVVTYSGASNPISASAISVARVWISGVPGVTDQYATVSGSGGSTGAWTLTTSATGTSTGSGGTLTAGVEGVIRAMKYTAQLWIDPYGDGQGIANDITAGIAAGNAIALADPQLNTVIAPHIYGGSTYCDAVITNITTSQMQYTVQTALQNAATVGSDPLINGSPAFVTGITAAPQFNNLVATPSGGTGGTSPNFVRNQSLAGSPSAGTGTDGYAIATADYRYELMKYAAQQSQGVCYCVEELGSRTPPTANGDDPSPGNYNMGAVRTTAASHDLGTIGWSWDGDRTGGSVSLGTLNSAGLGTAYGQWNSPANSPYQGWDDLLHPVWGPQVVATPASSFIGGSGSVTVPGNPSSLTPTVISATEVDLAWTAGTAGTYTIAGYNVQRALASTGPWTTVAVPSTNSYHDTSLTAASTYFWRTQTVDAQGNVSAGFSNTATATTSGTTALGAPTSMAENVISSSEIDLGWVNSTAGTYSRANYIVQRSTVGNTGPWTTIASPTLNDYADTSCAASTQYWYRAQAVDVHGGTSAFSSVVTGTTPAAPAPAQGNPISQFVLNAGSIAVTDIPAPALAAGYTTRTFGPNLVYAAVPNSIAGQNMAMFHFFGYNGSHPTPPVQQSDGSIIFPGNDAANAGIATAWVDTTKRNNWGGWAPGGGAFYRCVLKFNPVSGQIVGFPAWWAMNIEHLSGNLAWSQWSGQASGYQHWAEFDIMEFVLGSSISYYGTTFHDWYRDTTPATHHISQGSGAINPGVDFSVYNTFDLLWKPATPLSQGSATGYCNGTQYFQKFWNQFVNNGAYAPPPVAGSSAMAIADSVHMVPILGNGNQTNGIVMQVRSMEVWQAGSGYNLVQ